MSGCFLRKFIFKSTQNFFREDITFVRKKEAILQLWMQNDGTGIDVA